MITASILLLTSAVVAEISPEPYSSTAMVQPTETGDINKRVAPPPPPEKRVVCPRQIAVNMPHAVL